VTRDCGLWDAVIVLCGTGNGRGEAGTARGPGWPGCRPRADMAREQALRRMTGPEL